MPHLWRWGNYRKWRLVRRAYRLCVWNAPRGLAQATSTAGGHDCLLFFGEEERFKKGSSSPKPHYLLKFNKREGKKSGDNCEILIMANSYIQLCGGYRNIITIMNYLSVGICPSTIFQVSVLQNNISVKKTTLLILFNKIPSPNLSVAVAISPLTNKTPSIL